VRIEQLGPYQLVRELGHGGMGTVYEAFNLETGERAAVKILAAPLARGEDFRERFEAEIETLKKLNHPNIVRLFGFGEQGQYRFYAMELVDGDSLEQELARGRRFDWREVARIGIDTCRALRHAHDRGIIHRDIKPGNLLMASDGQVKLSDFGIARLFGNTRLTGVGTVLGTAEYMAPEQAEGRPVTPRADLYSLGAVLYVLLARRPLFRSKSLPELLHKQRFEKPEPVSHYAPDVPAALEQIITQLLEKDPDRRIPNPTLLARQLGAMRRALSLEPDREGSSTPEDEAGTVGSQGDAVLVPSGGESPPRSPAQLPPTRLADDLSADLLLTPHLPDGSAARPSDAMAPSADDLPDTKATAAFKHLDRSEADPRTNPTKASLRCPSVPGTPPADEEEPDAGTGLAGHRPKVGRATHFTPVAEEELDRAEPQREHHALISLHTWALAAALIAVGLSVWYFLQPPSKETLYERITARTGDDTAPSLLKAEGDIDAFLRLYSKDPRCEQLRQYKREIDLYRLERKFELRARGLAQAEHLLPIERAYLEAINYVRLDPERGMAKLQALIDLYDHRADTSGPTGQCLELARRRLAQLREELGQQTEQQLALLQERLDEARQLSRREPGRARAMYQAVIELYADKPWAAEPVRQARQALGAIDNRP
jgi:serine/threonine protein kinase